MKLEGVQTALVKIRAQSGGFHFRNHLGAQGPLPSAAGIVKRVLTADFIRCRTIQPPLIFVDGRVEAASLVLREMADFLAAGRFTPIPGMSNLRISTS